jgi:hypothetical protein
MTVLFLSDRMTFHRHRGPATRVISAIGVIAALAFSAACDETSILAPTGSELTLVAPTGTVAANGSLELTAHLFRGGYGAGDAGTITPGVGPPVRDDTIVTFVTSIGRMEPAEAKTKDGRVTVRLVGDGRAGTAKITAFSGPAFGTLDIVITEAGAGTSR